MTTKNPLMTIAVVSCAGRDPSIALLGAGRVPSMIRRNPMRRFSWLFAILIACLAAPLVAQAQPEPPTPTAPETDIAERYTPNRVDWQPCPENAEVECGTLTLPVDYRKPTGETFDMAVARIRAINPSTRIGVLFTNPGGPGISGVDFLIHVVPNVPLFASARERFDVVSFDPRGVGRSRPIQCEPEPLTLPDDSSDEALATIFDAFSAHYAESCLQQDGVFVTKVSTNNVARDMDMLRRSLGERKVTYASGSYGTQLGAVYASLFPKRLRAMALDGGIDPMFRDYYAEDTANQMAGFELELQRIDVLCRRDPACRLHETGVIGAFDRLVAQLNAEPYTSPEGVVLTGASVSEVVYALIYREQLAPLIVDVLANGLNRDYTLITEILPTVDAGLSAGALYAIRCNDYGTRRQAAEYLPVDEVVGARNPRFFGRFYLAYRLATCSAWSAADPPIIRNVQRQMDVPILLVMNDFDPATPPSAMRSLAFALGMERSVFRYQGGGHTFPKNDACVGNVFAAYVFDLKVPAEGSTCPGQPISFAPRAEANSTQSLDAATDTLWQFVEPLRVR